MTTRSPTQTSRRKAYGATALVALAAAFIGITILSAFVFRGARIDLTESGLYSIAAGTQRIVTSLPEPINLYFFFSQEDSADSPQLRAYAQRVRELLEELAQRSKGKVRLHVIDPKPFSEDEDRAAEFGLSAVPVRGAQLYFGLAGTNSTDGREVIGFFQPDKEQFLEYDVASLIHRLGNPKKAVVGVMSTLPVDASFDQMSGRMNEGWSSIAQLRELFTLRTIAPDATVIEKDVDVLVVIHPKDLTPQTSYAIDQFVMRGGKLMAFIDPQSENDPAGQQMGPGAPRASSLGPLLDAWGVSYDGTQVLGDRELGLTVALRQGDEPAQHIEIIGFNRGSMNAKDVVTSTLDVVNVMTGGFVTKKKDAPITFEPLIESSTNSAPVPVARVAFLPDAHKLVEDFKATGEHYAVAARVHGKLKSAFPNGNPAPEPGAPAEHLPETKADGDFIIVADTDILADPLWLQPRSMFGQRMMVPWANNGDFVANSVDNLAGSSDLISVRGRQSFFRPFTKVEELRRRADDQLRAKEQELDRELTDTEAKLTQLQASRANETSLSLSPEQEQEVRRFQEQRVRIRKDLRDVRRSLDVEIERLGTRLKVLNILAMPLLIAIGAIALAVVRSRRLRAGRAAAHTG